MLTPIPSRHSGKEWLAAAVIFAAVTFFAFQTQSPLTFNDGKGWDGMRYFNMALAFVNRETPTADLPFVNRLAAPFLAAKINPTDLRNGFKAVYLAAAALTFVLLVVWLRIHVRDWRIRVLLLLLYATQFHAPIRALHWYPVASDSLTHLGVITGLLLIHLLRRASTAVTVLTFTLFAAIGVTIREVMLLFPVAMLFAHNPIAIDTRVPWILRLRQRPSLWLLLPIVVGAACFYAIRRSVVTIPGYSPANELIAMLYTKSLISYLHGWMIAFGPVVALLIWKFRACARELWQRQSELVVFCACAGVGWVGGTDTERLVYWSFPLVYALIGRVIEANWWLLDRMGLLAVLAASQAVAQRIFWPMPDYPLPDVGRSLPILTLWGSRINVMNLWSWHAYNKIAVVLFVESAALILAILIWLRWAELRQARLPEGAREVPCETPLEEPPEGLMLEAASMEDKVPLASQFLSRQTEPDCGPGCPAGGDARPREIITFRVHGI